PPHDPHSFPTRRSSDLQGVTMEDLAEDLKAVLDAENTTICSMIGHSMGGYITLAFAEKYATRLDKFGLFHSSAFADNDEKKEARDRKSTRLNSSHVKNS